MDDCSIKPSIMWVLDKHTHSHLLLWKGHAGGGGDDDDGIAWGVNVIDHGCLLQKVIILPNQQLKGGPLPLFSSYFMRTRVLSKKSHPSSCSFSGSLFGIPLPNESISSLTHLPFWRWRQLQMDLDTPSTSFEEFFRPVSSFRYFVGRRQVLGVNQVTNFWRNLWKQEATTTDLGLHEGYKDIILIQKDTFQKNDQKAMYAPAIFLVKCLWWLMTPISQQLRLWAFPD